MRIKVAPSILAANLLDLGNEIKKIENGGADLVHIDIMDGMYVPNISLGFSYIESIKKITSVPLDVHLMINEPIKYVEKAISFGATYVTIHNDSSTREETLETLKKIKSLGAKPGIAISPNVDVKEILDFIPFVDMVLIMSVFPGYGGQKFIDVTNKISSVKNMIEKYPHIEIEVDGGINKETAKMCKDSGASILVAGTAIFKSDAIKTAIDNLR